MGDAPQQPELRFLGAGGAFSRRYGTTCSVLEFGGQRWLIDCGRQAPDQLHAAGLSWHECTGQLVTHVHGDHVFGIEDFAFMRFFSDGKVSAISRGGPRPQLAAHRAVLDELWEVLAPSLRYIERDGDMRAGVLEDYFEVLEPLRTEAPDGYDWPAAQSFELGGVELRTVQTEHVPGKPATGFEFSFYNPSGANAQQGRTTAFWSGDSVVNPSRLEELAAKCSVLFHDCTFVSYPGQVHGDYQRLRELPEHLRRKMVLMHHDDDMQDHRAEAEALGFRFALPGDRFDLVRGQRIEG